MKTPKGSQLIRVLLASFVLILFVTQFQNCSKSLGIGNSPQSTEKLDGGNGYDGKTSQRFVVWDTKGQCADGIREIINVESVNGIVETATKTRRDCQDIPPEPVILSSDALVRYNPANLVSDNTPFDLFTENGNTASTGILCRGEVEKRNRNVRIVADVVITSSTTRGFRGHVILGVFDLTTGAYLNKEDGEDVPLTRLIGDQCDGGNCDLKFEYFVRRDSQNREWRLVVPTTTGEPGAIHISVSDTERITAKIPCFRR